MQSPIPLDVLNERIEDTFPTFSVGLLNCLQNAGITRNWQLLVQCEASVLGIKNLGRKSLNNIKDALLGKKWKLGMFYPESQPLTSRILLSEWFWVLPVEVIGPDVQTLDHTTREHVLHYFAQHGLHANMTIDELFVYVPTERPPLTEAQVKFLNMRTNDVCTKEESTWCNPLRGSDRHQTVFDIALVIPHMRADDEHKDVIARIRAYIEAEVGPLPLALSSDELRNFFR